MSRDWRAPRRRFNPQTIARAVIALVAVAFIAGVVLAIVRPWSGGYSEAEEAISDRVAALEDAAVVEIGGEIESGYDFTGQIDDRVIVGTLYVDQSDVPFVVTATDTYLLGSPNVWGALGYEGEFVGWVNAREAVDFTAASGPSMSRIVAAVGEGATGQDSRGRLNYPGGITMWLNDGSLMVREGDSEVSLRTAAGTGSERAEMIAGAIETPARVVRTTGGDYRVDGPPQMPEEHHDEGDLPPPPPEGEEEHP